jgi:hypothetical protein
MVNGQWSMVNGYLFLVIIPSYHRNPLLSIHPDGQRFAEMSNIEKVGLTNVLLFSQNIVPYKAI